MKRCLSAVVGGIGVLSTVVVAQADEYKEICDASAAIYLGDNRFVVAEDEKSNQLYTYQIGTAKPQAKLDLRDYLAHTFNDGESDLEAAARIGDKVYWLSSLGLSKKAKFEESRFGFFATPVVLQGNKSVLAMPKKPPVTSLRRAVLEQVSDEFGLKDAQMLPPKKGGMNFEGLAAGANGSLLMGMRSPLAEDNKAMIITLHNPDQVIDGKEPKIGDVHVVDLDGRAIRSLEKIPDGYLILGGKTGGGSPDTRLYSWAGPGDEKPKELMQLGDLNGEALFIIKQGLAYILSDDGRVKIDHKKCKKSPLTHKYFRAQAVSYSIQYDG